MTTPPKGGKSIGLILYSIFAEDQGKCFYGMQLIIIN